jgi:hypothetical protein
MDHKFDSVAKAMATGNSRRTALKWFGGMLGGMLVGSPLVGYAARPTNPPGGSGTQACNSFCNRNSTNPRDRQQCMNACLQCNGDTNRICGQFGAFVCAPSGATCCGTSYCVSGKICSNGVCCNSGETGCGQTCCASGFACCNGSCCPSSGQLCTSGVCTCPADKPFVDQYGNCTDRYEANILTCVCFDESTQTQTNIERCTTLSCTDAIPMCQQICTGHGTVVTRDCLPHGTCFANDPVYP